MTFVPAVKGRIQVVTDIARVMKQTAVRSIREVRMNERKQWCPVTFVIRARITVLAVNAARMTAAQSRKQDTGRMERWQRNPEMSMLVETAAIMNDRAMGKERGLLPASGRGKEEMKPGTCDGNLQAMMKMTVRPAQRNIQTGKENPSATGMSFHAIFSEPIHSESGGMMSVPTFGSIPK